jgi:hypothetical protein
MKIKIISFKVWQGNKAEVQSHNLRKGKWIENKNFEMYQRLHRESPVRFVYFKETKREVSNG